ncbi:cytochrome P450 1A1-like [Mya arenaria]|uniref:cytochrome P450 1A1-like n=1 Tax=Mya arenaria TaxID=6604 RepID=UPI0022E33D29|nr:cytochrome P450 1A1-like [Mya arenaria]
MRVRSLSLTRLEESTSSRRSSVPDMPAQVHNSRTKNRNGFSQTGCIQTDPGDSQWSGIFRCLENSSLSSSWSGVKHTATFTGYEIDSVVGQERPPALTDKPRLVYTAAVIQEVMRIVAMLPVSLPHYAIQDAIICGYHVDKDTVVILNMFSVSHEARVWGDPDNFRPGCFSTESGEINTSLLGHSLPFGLGRRRCVGEQLANISLYILFSSLMQQCRCSLPGSADLTSVPELVSTPEKCNIIVQNRN